MQVISTIEDYIMNSLQFLQGLMHAHELLANVREHRDRFIVRLLVDLYLNHAFNLFQEGAGAQDFILVRSLLLAPGTFSRLFRSSVKLPIDQVRCYVFK
jgi:hypothetical protein